MGIEPSELHFMPMEVFVARFRERDLAEIAYNHHETVRKGRCALKDGAHDLLALESCASCPWLKPIVSVRQRDLAEVANSQHKIVRKVSTSMPPSSFSRA
jgi:hypothetical protein